jgi:hypothetical protein
MRVEILIASDINIFRDVTSRSAAERILSHSLSSDTDVEE